MKKNAPPPTTGKSPDHSEAQLAKENSPEEAIPSLRPIEPVCVASPVHEDIPQSEPQASPTRDEPNISVPPSAQPQIPEDKSQPPPVQVQK